MITGLEMARSYFTQWGLPFLRQHFPSISERVAAGIWRGSQIFGADDALSRDHGWGAMFTLVLTEQDFQTTAERLNQTLQENAPTVWKGFPTPSDAEIIVTSIDRFFQDHVGFSTPPQDSSEWLEVEGATLSSPRLTFSTTHDRYWQLVIDERDSVETTSLSLGFIPATLLFIAKSETPFTLAYGHATASSVAFSFDEFRQLLPEGFR